MKERAYNILFSRRRALYSDDERYRYLLEIVWNDDLSACAFIGLNPSTATEMKDDPTITRCLHFAADFGCGALVMLNLFAFRATDPLAMMAADDPAGADNSALFMIEQAARCQYTIAAWGAHGRFMQRAETIRSEFSNAGVRLLALRISPKTGEPWHPLYLPGSCRPIPLPEK